MSCCGLVTDQKEPVPLKNIDIELEVKDHVATVVSTLLYENKEDKPIEAVFVFPIPGDAAVCHFSAKIGPTEIVAEVKEKEKAREEYDDALSSGQQAFLLEESDQSPDIFTLSVGSLPPQESASIRLEYVTELALQADDGLRFCLPAVLNPRYQPQGSSNDSVQVTSIPASLVPYGLSFTARVSSPRPVSKVESNCSLDPVQFLNTEQTQATVKLAAGHKFDRDVELLIYYKDAHQPTAVVEAGQTSAEPGTLMGDQAVMLTLYPEFPQDVMSSVSSCGEFVFLMDRSGSMACAINEQVNSDYTETRIGSARDTLLLLLKSLPIGCYFNIYSFGSSFEHIFPKSVEYNEETMEQAIKKAEKMQANLGGTEILEALKHIYSQPCIPNQPRQIFVFTDGEVTNTKEVLQLVKKNSGFHRCFSFGIGEGASTALIGGLAKEGRGHAQFITGMERMQSKVMQSLRFALQPAVEDISITWGLPKGMSATVRSPPVTTIFHGQRVLIYAQLTGERSATAEGCVTVKYSLAGHPTQSQFCFSLQPSQNDGLTVHRLSALTMIRSLGMMEEMGDIQEQQGGVREKIVDLSVQSGVSSAYTSFIAVDKNSNKAVEGPALRRNIPIGFLHGPPMPMMMMCSAAPACPKINFHHNAMYFDHEDSMDDDDFGGAQDDFLMKSCLMSCNESLDLSYRPDDEEEDLICSNLKATDNADFPPKQRVRDPMLHLVSLQKASGCWLLEESLASALGKTFEEVESPKPSGANKEVWATILALIWLYGFKFDAQDEWELLAMKAVSWLRSQREPRVAECVEAGNALLGCEVKKDTLGI